MRQETLEPLVPLPAGRLAERYARRMRTLSGPVRVRDGIPGPHGPTAADTADSLRWARPGRRSARRTSQR